MPNPTFYIHFANKQLSCPYPILLTCPRCVGFSVCLFWGFFLTPTLIYTQFANLDPTYPSGQMLNILLSKRPFPLPATQLEVISPPL